MRFWSKHRSFGYGHRASWLLGCALVVVLGSGSGWYLHTHPKLDIAAQDVDTALLELAMQVGVQVVFAPGLVEGRECSGIQGRMSLEAALESILADTGVQYEYSSDRVILVSNPELATRA